MSYVEDSIGNGRAVERWCTRWRQYIKTSRRDSSSARTTAENFIKLARIARDSRVVDLGCGHGRITELLVERVPSLQLVGVDFTRPMLDTFLVRPGTNECKIDLVCADITKLPLDDDSFDAVVSSRVFQYLPDPLSGIREAARVGQHGIVFGMMNRNSPKVVRRRVQQLFGKNPFYVTATFYTPQKLIEIIDEALQGRNYSIEWSCTGLPKWFPVQQWSFPYGDFFGLYVKLLS